MQTLYFIEYKQPTGLCVSSAQQDEKAIHTGFQHGAMFIPSWRIFLTHELALKQLSRDVLECGEHSI